MSIKVEASRFAVLNIDDDDSNIKNKQKSSMNNQNNKNKNIKNQPKNNNNQMGKSNVQKSKKNPIQSNGLNNLNQVKNNSSNENNSHVLSLSKKKVDTKEDQWDQWREMDEKFVEKEFQEQLKLVVEESKKDNKLKTIDKHSHSESNFSNKKDIKNIEDNKTVLPDFASQQTQPKSKKDKVKKVEKLDDTLTNLSIDDQLEIKNQSILELQKIIENIQVEIGDYKNKNQKVCKYLLQGETSSLCDMEHNISNLREKHNQQTLKLTQLSTELEKERSKGHFLRSELNKIKAHKEATTK